MNLKTTDPQGTEQSEGSPDNFGGSLDSEAVQVPLPENIDGLFGVSLSLPENFATSEGSLEQFSGTDQVFDDGYSCIQTDASSPVDARDMSVFSKHITDACMSVPATFSMQLPWETGIMQQIFESTDGLPDLPIPRAEPIEVVDSPRGAPKFPSCPDPLRQGGGRGVYLRVINFGLNLSEDDLEQKSWSNALEKWYIIFRTGRNAWPQGYDLDQAVETHDLENLRKVFGNRSANTVLRRGNSMVRFLKWFQKVRFSTCPFPIFEGDIEEYLNHLVHNGAGSSALSGFLEALRFCEHVVGIAGVSSSISLKARKISELADMKRQDKKQSRVLTVLEVQTLETILMDETEELADRYAAGAMLFGLYSRSRLSDLKKIKGFYKDVIEVNGTISGYLEYKTRSHKTARLTAKQGITRPLVAPVWGLMTPPWGLNFVKVAKLARRDLELIYDESLLPAPAGCGEQWQQRAVSTSEAGSWLRSLLSKRLGEIDYTTIHTLKSTPLSWCAKAGLSEPTRLMLGHHVTGKHSADVYARDVLAAPLREFDTVLQQIRNGALRPDATRSGMLSAPSQEDPKDTFAVEESRVPDEEDQSSSSESDSCSDESHSGLVEPNDPAADDRWDPDFDMFQHKKSKIVHVRAVGSQQKTFSCGVRETKDFEQVKSVDFLVFRKCKRCTTAKPLKDVGALASALKKTTS